MIFMMSSQRIFYRELDIKIKKIQEIRQSTSVADLEHVLAEQEAKILEELTYKKRLLKKIKTVKEDYYRIKEHLGKYTVTDMKPLEVKGEITEYAAYEEYEIIRNSTESIKNAVTLTSARRVIHFDEEGMKEERFIVVRKIEDSDQNLIGEVLSHPKCIYTMIEDGRFVNGEKSIDHEVGESLLKIAIENGYEFIGTAYINILLTTYEEGLERVFLEMYAPIK